MIETAARARFVSSADDGLLELLAVVSRAVFDLDGTLYDTRDFERPALAAVARWLRERSGQPLEGLEVLLWERRETRRHERGLFDEQLQLNRLPMSWGPECARLFWEYPGDELARVPNLRHTLATLRARDTRLALVTNGRERLQQRKLRQLGLEEFFDACVYCEPERPEQLKPRDWAWQRLQSWRAGGVTAYLGDDDAVDARFAAAGDALFVRVMFRNSLYGN